MSCRRRSSRPACPAGWSRGGAWKSASTKAPPDLSRWSPGRRAPARRWPSLRGRPPGLAPWRGSRSTITTASRRSSGLPSWRQCGTRESHLRRVSAAPARTAASDHVFLLRLASELAAQDPPVVLVLDDLHLLAGPGLMDGLQYLLRNARSGLRLVICSRTDPMLPLHRYRLAGELTEIRASELAFSVPEARLADGAAWHHAAAKDARTPDRAGRGLGRGTAPGCDLDRRAPRPRAIHQGTRRREQRHRRLPDRGGAQQPARRDPGSAAENQHPGPGQLRHRQ